MPLPTARDRSCALLLLSLGVLACTPSSPADGGTGGGAGGGGGGAGGGEPDGGWQLTLPVPEDFAAVPSGPAQVTLTWTSDAGLDAGFELERALADGGEFAPRAQGALAAGSFTDDGLAADTAYSWRLRAALGDARSAWTATVTAAPVAVVVATAPPAPPTGLAVATAGESSLGLSWTDGSTDEAGFEVQRALAAAGPFGTVHRSDAGVQAWTDTGLAAGSAYHYRVRAVNAAGASDYTAVAAGTTAQPTAPTGLAATQEVLNSASAVRVTWTDASQAESGYEVQRSMDGTTWNPPVMLPANSAAWVDLAPTFGTNHYRLRATSGTGASAWVGTSTYAGAIIVGYLCPQPEAVSATALSETSGRVRWTWSTVADCALVAIERAESSSGPWAEVARQYYFFSIPPAPLDSGQWDDPGLQPGRTYHYRLRSIGLNSSWNSSGYAPSASLTTPSTLAAPTNLVVTVTSATTANFSFTDPATDETGFAVDIATASTGPFQEVFRLPANQPQGFVEGLTPGTQYWMRVRTLKNAVSSAPSAAVGFTSASRVELRTTGDATVVDSVGNSSLRAVNISNQANSVGCFFTWTVDLGANLYLLYNCYGSALRFDASALTGKTVLSARLVLTPCALAPHPVSDAQYAAFALAGPWDPATVTFLTLPQLRTTGGWAVPAPTTPSPSVFDLTTIVRNWAGGAWPNHGIWVQQYPITPRQPNWGGQVRNAQDQVTPYCSLEQNGSVPARAPTLVVDYR